MLLAAAILVVLTANENDVTENFTGRVLDGSNDRLIRVERKPVAGKRPTSVVVLQDCGPLEPGSLHQFAIWAGGWEDVRPCLAVNGRPPEPLSRNLPAGFGVLYGQVRIVDDQSSRLLPSAPVEIRCGDKTWTGKTDRSGRFWTMLPAGHCRVEGMADGFRPYDPNGLPVLVRGSAVDFALVKMKPWGLIDRIEGLFQSLFSR